MTERGRRLDEDRVCPTCGAEVGERCWTVRTERDGTVVRLHPSERHHAARLDPDRSDRKRQRIRDRYRESRP